MAVRIEVTSENGEVDNYYLVISKAAAAEDAKALLKKIKGDNAPADKAAADAVIGKIAAIGTVSLDSKAAIVEARAAYNALTITQRSLVTNYETLTAAETKLVELKAAADKAAADAVVEKIAAIGTVTKDSKTAIESARAAYDALTAEQKTLVTNYETLTAAEKALANLNKPADPDNPQTGDSTNIMLYTTIMLVSLMAIAALLLTSKKKYNH
jgi:LPXTG-motif cell wall-anchored protein